MMKKTLMTLMMAGTVMSTAAIANSGTMNTNASANANTSQQQSATTSGNRNIAAMEDGNMVSLTGTVAEIRDDEFDLNYGGNRTVTVELDSFGFNGDETRYLTQGESVTVTGEIDDDLFEGREIEASEVMLNDSYVIYYTDMPTMMNTGMSQQNRGQNQNRTAAGNNNQAMLEDGAYISMVGQVTGLNGEIATVRGNNRVMTVDMSELGYDPLDNEGMQQINTGDRIYVYGEIDDNFMQNKRLVADGVIELQQRNTNTQNRNRS